MAYQGDPYEEWKQAGRPEGSFEAWMASQSGGAAPVNPANPASSSAAAPTTSVDPAAAQRALSNAGGPGKVGLPANASQDQINAWFQQAVSAGGYTEDGYNTSETAYTRSGYNATGQDATGFRKMAKDNKWSEDMDRWSESQLANWKKSYDPTCPPNDPFRSDADGSCVQKPIDQGGTTMPGGAPNPKAGVGAGEGGPGGGGGNGGNGGQPAVPPPPVTFGNQLTMTGNPMQDMLINQFNTGANSTYGQGNNLFGLGEDRTVGGVGANADMTGGAQANKAQTLSGGGLWWGAGDFNAGFDASKKNSEEANAASPAAPPAQATPDPAATPAAPNMNALTKSAPGSLQDRRSDLGRRPRNVGGMLYNQYQGQPKTGSFF